MAYRCIELTGIPCCVKASEGFSTGNIFFTDLSVNNNIYDSSWAATGTYETIYTCGDIQILLNKTDRGGGIYNIAIYPKDVVNNVYFTGVDMIQKVYVNLGVFVVIDDNTELGEIVIGSATSDWGEDYYYNVPNFNPTHDKYLSIINNIAPQYVWHSVVALSGNDNQFRINLSTIANQAIGDYQTTYTAQSDDAFTLPNQADMRSLCINIPVDQWVIIGYCGNNKLKAYKTYHSASHYYTIKLKFEFEDGTTAYILDNEHLSYNEASTFWSYLGFIEDIGNEVAVCDFIVHQEAVYQTPASWSYNYDRPQLSDMESLYSWLHPASYTPPDESDDPYDTGSTDLGGEGGLPTPQDSLQIGSAPTKGGLELGFMTLYCPTDAQLGQIAAFLWSDDVLENFKKYFNNFADNIISLYVLPYTPTGMSTKKFKVGNMESETIGYVSYVTDRVVDLDMGEFVINPKWTSYLDYSPYTKFEVYLPYCGMHSLDADELLSPANMEGYLSDKQGCKLSLTYRLDLLTGNIIAYLKINGEIRYQFNGKCGYQVPLTGQTYNNMVQGIITAGATLATTLALGGLSAPLGAGMIGSAVGAAVSGTVQAQKPNVYRAGNLSGDVSMLAYDTPYIIRTMPSKAECKNLKNYTGYPSYKTGKLSEFSGFTVCIEAHVETISCTEEERSKILAYLKEGVII